MKKHKFVYFDINADKLLDRYSSLYCLKCDMCYCRICLERMGDNDILTICGMIQNVKATSDQVNIILENHECILSDDEYIIKQIIE